MLPDVGMVKTYSKSANVLTCSGGFLPVGFAMPHRFALHKLHDVCIFLLC